MKQKKSAKKLIMQMLKGRAARACAAAVTVFLCMLTLLEFTALELEWEIPVVAVVSGEKTFSVLNYEKVEAALEDSAENILLEEPPAQGESSAQENSPAQGETLAQENSSAQGESPAQENSPAQGEQNKTEISENPGEIVDTTESSLVKDAPMEEKQPDTEKIPAAEFPYYIKVNRKQNCITIYTLDEDGEYTVPYKAMICSTGLYNATPRGKFDLSTKYLWRELYGGVYGQYATRIHGGILFHSVPYYRRSKSSLCTDKYNKLGQQASMGCIRLTVEDAKWIAENCPAGTTVEIYEDEDPGPLGKPEAVKLDMDNPNKGWDPTDPDADNPWNQLSKDK